MKVKHLSLIVLAFFVAACSNPVPENKSDYVGEWKSNEMYLLILQDGTVAYKRLKNGGTVSVNGPLKEFAGDDFIVGVSFFTTAFKVTAAPEKIDDTWTMTVDGIQLTKTEEQNLNRHE